MSAEVNSEHGDAMHTIRIELSGEIRCTTCGSSCDDLMSYPDRTEGPEQSKMLYDVLAQVETTDNRGFNMDLPLFITQDEEPDASSRSLTRLARPVSISVSARVTFSRIRAPRGDAFLVKLTTFSRPVSGTVYESGIAGLGTYLIDLDMIAYGEALGTVKQRISSYITGQYQALIAKASRESSGSPEAFCSSSSCLETLDARGNVSARDFTCIILTGLCERCYRQENDSFIVPTSDVPEVL